MKPLKRAINCIYKGGGTSASEVDSGGVAYVTPEALSDAIEAKCHRRIQGEEFTVAPAGAVALCTIGAGVGKSALVREPFITNPQVIGLDVSQTASCRYVAYVLKAKFERFQMLANPGVIPYSTPSTLLDEPAWLPERSVQERVANFLDDKTARIDALIAEKERLVERLAAFQYSFASSAMTRGLDPAAKLVETSSSELGAIPSHWKLERLKFLGDVRSGVAKGKDLGTSKTVQLPYLRVANVQDGYLDLTDVHEIEVAESDAQRYLLQRGDVLMNEGGDNDKLGRGAVWQGQVEPCIHQNHVFAVRLRDPNLSDWVARFTSTDAARTYFFLRSKQSTNLASINQSNVRELPVPMPPDAERERILSEVRRVSKNVQDLSDHALKHIARLREYRSSLISAAVTGQLDLGAVKEHA